MFQIAKLERFCPKKSVILFALLSNSQHTFAPWLMTVHVSCSEPPLWTWQQRTDVEFGNTKSEVDILFK